MNNTIEMREEDWEETQENSKWENRDSWRFSAIVDPHLWKGF